MDGETRKQTISLVDTYLTYLACANKPLKQFDKCLVMTPEFAETDTTSGAVADMGAKATDLDCAWTIRVLARPALDGNAEVGRGLLTLYENRTVARGEVNRFKPRMPNANPDFYDCFVRHSAATIFESGRVAEDMVYAAMRKSNITIWDPSRIVTAEGIWSREKDPKDELCIRLLMGTALYLPTFWLAHVAISNNTPRVTLPTDPTGIKELWKFRDVPDGAKRRDALLHWVNDHWRKTRKDPEVEAYVRKHLRGGRTLTCEGLSVQVEESSEDKAAIVDIGRSRGQMRIKHVDRRRIKKLGGP